MFLMQDSTAIGSNLGGGQMNFYCLSPGKGKVYVMLTVSVMTH